MTRVVSLLASGTEIVCALGHRAGLVGRSHECDFPEDVATLPQVSVPSFPISGTSRAIDLAVKDRLRKALSIYEVDGDLLASLEPDVIVTQTQCEVCAVSPRDVERAACDLTQRDIKVVALEPHGLADIWTDIERVASALNVSERGATLIAGLREAMGKIGNQTSGGTTPPDPRRPRPSVVTIEWIDPLMTAGNWMPELVEFAGGRSLIGKAGTHSPWMTWDQLVEADPDVLVVSPCGFTIDRTVEEMSVLANHHAWRTLRAVAADRVFVADGNAYFHRPGPRVVESAQILAEILHGSGGGRSFEGAGYIRWSAPHT